MNKFKFFTWGVGMWLACQGCGHDPGEEKESPTTPRISKMELKNDSERAITVNARYGCQRTGYIVGDTETFVIDPGETVEERWDYRCEKSKQSALEVDYKYEEISASDDDATYAFHYLPYIGVPLVVGDSIALKGHSDDISEIVLEAKHFNLEDFPELSGDFTDRIRITDERLLIRGFTDSDVYYLGFPEHELNDYVLPKPGFETEDGMLMQQLEVDRFVVETPEGDFSHPNLSILCDADGCEAEKLGEIRPEEEEL